MNLSLFNKRNNNDSFTSKFIEELKSSLNKIINKEENISKNENIIEEINTDKSKDFNNKDINHKDNELNEYNIYEKKKIILDNHSRRGNDLAWVMDDNSVCISENGDGGPISINEIDLPEDYKVGEVYEKINEEYVYNSNLTAEINEVENL